MHSISDDRSNAKARGGLLRALTRRPSYRPFRKLARACGIHSLRVGGEYGVIEGATGDRAIFSVYAQTGTWSPVKNKMLTDFFAARGGGIYLDIGANIGLTTIPVAQNAAVRCLAFEPEPRNFAFLQRNVARNCRHGNVEFFNVALLDRRGAIAFELSDVNMGDHRVRHRVADGSFAEAQRPAIEVKADRLDNFITLKELHRPLAVKLIAQGAEGAILRGGEEILAAAELLILQFYPYQLERLDADPLDLCRFIARSFDAGMVMRGESEGTPAWRPIGEVVDDATRCVASQTLASHEYFYFVVRKTEKISA